MSRLIQMAKVDEIHPGGSKIVPVQGREILIINNDGTFYAIKNSCPHQGGQLNRGAIERGVITCPGHAWRFDLKTGDALDHPPLGLRCYRVEVRDGSVWVEIP